MIAPLALLLAATAPPPALVLAPDGLTLADGRRARFGIPAAAATALVTAALGKPLAQGVYPDCGQGEPIRHVDFRGKLELSFMHGTFVGWTLAEGGAPLRTARGIGLGSRFAPIRSAYPDATIDADGETPTLVSEQAPSGFLDGKGPQAKLVELHAGATCIVN